MHRKIFHGALLCVSALAFAMTATAGDTAKQVWGGGMPQDSSYSGKYVPLIIELLSEKRLDGYTWGGKSD